MRLARGGRRSTIAWVGVAMVGLLVAVAVLAPLLAPYDPGARSGRPFERPSGAHLLGTDDAGHDLLSLLLYGAQVSLAVGIAAAASATVLGATIGLTAGWTRGWSDALLMRLVDAVLALPMLPLVIVAVAYMGAGLATQIAVITAVLWAPMARELRAQVLSVRELGSIESARAIGSRPVHLLRYHVLPEVAPVMTGQFVLAVRSAILLEAALSFLGLGDAGAVSWGTTLHYAQARSAFQTDAWLWWVVPPGIGLVVLVLGFALLGYAIEDRVHPQLRWRGGARRVPRRPPARPAPALPADANGAVLRLEGLRVMYASTSGPVTALDGVCLAVQPGEVVGIVGESGSGKTTMVMAALGLLPPSARTTEGRILLCGTDVSNTRDAAMRRLRGDRVALVPQQSMEALNPVFRVGDQLAEAITLHRPVTRTEARCRAAGLLEQVGVNPGWAARFPHELSGGMRQRAVIAMALANDPALIVADEPTAGLDVLNALRILDLFADLQRRRGSALLLVSHDLSAVLRVADRVVVMRAGRVVEEGPATRVATAPDHPYTRALLRAVDARSVPARP